MVLGNMWKFILLAVMSAKCASQSCTPDSNVIKFLIKNERNITGHWNAQVNLMHNTGKNKTGFWEVGLEQVTEQCGHFNNIKILADISVSEQELFLSRKIPGPSYELIPELGYYKFHPEPKTWFEARDTCLLEGAHLVVINSLREASALLHFWVPHPKIYTDWKNEWAHVGFHDQYVEGEYVTIFGDLLNSSGYEKWYPGKPNKGAHINCGAAERKASLLSDAYCTSEFAFFCEQEL